MIDLSLIVALVDIIAVIICVFTFRRKDVKPRVPIISGIIFMVLFGVLFAAKKFNFTLPSVTLSTLPNQEQYGKLTVTLFNCLPSFAVVFFPLGLYSAIHNRKKTEVNSEGQR